MITAAALAAGLGVCEKCAGSVRAWHAGLTREQIQLLVQAPSSIKAIREQLVAPGHIVQPPGCKRDDALMAVQALVRKFEQG